MTTSSPSTPAPAAPAAAPNSPAPSAAASAPPASATPTPADATTTKPAEPGILARDPAATTTPAPAAAAAAQPDSGKPGDKPGAAGEPAKPAAGVPEKYELKAPDGLTLDDKLLARFDPIFRKANLTNEQAQQLAEGYAGYAAEQLQAMQKQYQDDVTKQNEEWAAQVRKDPQLGGANYDATVQRAALAIGKVGTPELRKFLDTTGLANHPELVRAFDKMGAMLQEAGLIRGTDTAPASPKSIEQRMYPNMRANGVAASPN